MSLCGLYPPAEVEMPVPSCEAAKMQYMQGVSVSKIPAAVACKAEDGSVGTADFSLRYYEMAKRKLPVVAPTPCTQSAQ